jgi:hypothetical protein
MEKIKGIPMSYIYINGDLTEEMFNTFLTIIHQMHSIQSTEPCCLDINDIYTSKIIERYNEHFEYYKQFKNSEIVYNELIDFFNRYTNEQYGVSHGDLVFSNIIVNNNYHYKMIDMRGIYNNKLSIYSDIYYDYAKIYQSLIGYDEILLNKKVSNDYRNKCINIFFNYIRQMYGEDQVYNIKMITKSHIFSLLPLHHNEKCETFYELLTSVH